MPRKRIAGFGRVSERQLRKEFWRTHPWVPRGKSVMYTPSGYKDVSYSKDTTDAWRYFLDRKVEQGVISPEQARQAVLAGVTEGAMRGAMERADLGEFGEAKPLTLAAATPALVGGGSAAVVTAGVRGLAPAGSGWSRHAGLIGAGGGVLLALATKQGGAAIAAALLVGLAVEGIEKLTELRMTQGG